MEKKVTVKNKVKPVSVCMYLRKVFYILSTSAILQAYRLLGKAVSRLVPACYVTFLNLTVVRHKTEWVSITVLSLTSHVTVHSLFNLSVLEFLL